MQSVNLEFFIFFYIFRTKKTNGRGREYYGLAVAEVGRGRG